MVATVKIGRKKIKLRKKKNLVIDDGDDPYF
jgi:hypothetical protein